MKDGYRPEGRSEDLAPPATPVDGVSPPARCPTCGLGRDTDGDGDCPICARPRARRAEPLIEIANLLGWRPDQRLSWSRHPMVAEGWVLMGEDIQATHAFIPQAIPALDFATTPHEAALVTWASLQAGVRLRERITQLEARLLPPQDTTNYEHWASSLAASAGIRDKAVVQHIASCLRRAHANGVRGVPHVEESP